jgi:hypothetical protein
MESTMASEVESVDSGIAPKPSTGSFHFMQASELESSFEDTAEWVDRADAVQSTEEIADDAMEVRTEVDANGQHLGEEQEALKEVK